MSVTGTQPGRQENLRIGSAPLNSARRVGLSPAVDHSDKLSLTKERQTRLMTSNNLWLIRSSGNRFEWTNKTPGKYWVKEWQAY
jgi:hypothetical protein